jgi:hypothetical protein
MIRPRDIQELAADPELRSILATVERNLPSKLERTKQKMRAGRREFSKDGLIARIIRLEHEMQMAREELDLYRPLIMKLAEGIK